MNKCLVLFVEGDTEVEFYKRVIANAISGRHCRTLQCLLWHLHKFYALQQLWIQRIILLSE